MITDYLKQGKENAVSLEYLAKAYRAYNRSYWQSGIEKDKGIARCMERKFSGQMEMEL